MIFLKRYMLLLTNELPFNINSYLLPFAIVVAICFAIMVVFMVSDSLYLYTYLGFRKFWEA